MPREQFAGGDAATRDARLLASGVRPPQPSSLERERRERARPPSHEHGPVGRPGCPAGLVAALPDEQAVASFPGALDPTGARPREPRSPEKEEPRADAARPAGQLPWDPFS